MTATTPQFSSALAFRYRLERTLGEGAMATVYLAEDLRHHRRVAAKVLKPELSGAPTDTLAELVEKGRTMTPAAVLAMVAWQ